mgnify:CR=1 FL=1
MLYRYLAHGVVQEKEVTPSFAQHYDLIVAGVGTAGAYAVLAAARQGVSVLGIDKNSGAGGMGTFGYVAGYYYGVGGGLHQEIDKEAEALKDDLFCSDMEAKKYLLEKHATDAGAQFLFEARLTGVFIEDKTVKGVSVFSKGGLVNYACSILIDATAEADVCSMAGCELRCGRASDGKTSPFTGVKVSLTEKGELSGSNLDSGYANQYDPAYLSRSIVWAHSNHHYDPHARTLFLAPQIGIREGKRIASEEDITMEDILAGKRTQAPLFYAYADFDKHGKDNALETEIMQDWRVACNLSTVCLSVPISLKTLIPKGYKSLLVAGRHLGVDHDTASLVRMKQDLQKCGESAGVCAALAIKRGAQPPDVPYEEVKALLVKTGCLNEAHDVGMMFDDDFRRMKIQWLEDPAEIKRQLGTDMPGIALYSCKLLGDRIRRNLVSWLDDEDNMLAQNSAVALGLLKDHACLPYLREIVKRRDSFYYKDCRRTNQLRSAIAIYLLGKFGDPESVPLFREILCDQSEIQKDLYHRIKDPSYKFSLNEDFNEVYFQIISHAAVALTKIIAKNPSVKQEGLAILQEAFQDDRQIRNTTSLPPETSEYETINNIKKYVESFCAAN